MKDKERGHIGVRPSVSHQPSDVRPTKPGHKRPFLKYCGIHV